MKVYERFVGALLLLALLLLVLVMGTRLVQELTEPDYVVYVCYPEGSDQNCSQQ